MTLLHGNILLCLGYAHYALEAGYKLMHVASVHSQLPDEVSSSFYIRPDM